MPWTCPNCRKQFKNRNQAHSCVRTEVADHFENKAPSIRATYDKLITELKKIGPITVNPVKHGIMIKAATTFVALKPKRDRLDLEFILNKEIVDFSVHKTVRYSPRRFAHFVALEKPGDVTRKLIKWLRDSYELVRS